MMKSLQHVEAFIIMLSLIASLKLLPWRNGTKEQREIHQNWPFTCNRPEKNISWGNYSSRSVGWIPVIILYCESADLLLNLKRASMLALKRATNQCSLHVFSCWAKPFSVGQTFRSPEQKRSLYQTSTQHNKCATFNFNVLFLFVLTLDLN